MGTDRGLFLLTLVSRRVSSGFTIRSGHFAERHGLMILIVLGESLVSVGVAASGERPRPAAGDRSAVRVPGDRRALVGLLRGRRRGGRGEFRREGRGDQVRLGRPRLRPDSFVDDRRRDCHRRRHQARSARSARPGGPLRGGPDRGGGRRSTSPRPPGSAGSSASPAVAPVLSVPPWCSCPRSSGSRSAPANNWLWSPSSSARPRYFRRREDGDRPRRRPRTGAG